MNRFVRRGVIGLVAGLVSSLVVLAAFHDAPHVALALLVGVGYALAFRPSRGGYADSLMSAAAMGVPLWALFDIIVFPVANGQPPQWTGAGMRAQFPYLVGWVVFGAVLGLMVQALTDLALRRLGPEPEPKIEPVTPTRVVVVGGGFAGVTTAQRLEKLFGPDPSIAIQLVSETNALLFTPMLAEVAASSLEPTHISTPLRTSLHRTEVIRGRVASIDLNAKQVLLASDHDAPEMVTHEALRYDHLVLSLGAVSNYFGNKGIEENSFDFKSLADAIGIRNHVIDMFDRASREPDRVRRQAMVTFVIAGAGFSGAELAGGLNDFARGMLAYYPNIPPEDVRIIVAHPADRILPELTESLARYALQRMAARGVTFKLHTRVADARPGVVVLNPAEEIRTETLVWTAGTRPNPVVQALPVELSKRGAVVVDTTLAVPGQPGVWALGDCAAVTDAKTGQPCPPTAQFALREAYTVAHNIHATLRGQPLKPFHFDALGILAVVGHHTACAEIRGLRFSGLFAWLMWRGIYLSKLPGLERQVRVLSDWIIELFFPRDIVQTIDVSDRASRQQARATAVPSAPAEGAIGKTLVGEPGHSA
ncbi:MAG: NAD(P)/FAD-dependent oxidoreductase [Anaerolineae bacterium]